MCVSVFVFACGGKRKGIKKILNIIHKEGNEINKKKKLNVSLLVDTRLRKTAIFLRAFDWSAIKAWSVINCLGLPEALTVGGKENK